MGVDPGSAAHRFTLRCVRDTWLPLDAIGPIWRAWDKPMPDAAVHSPRFASRPALLVGAVCGVLIAATLLLWAHYGTAVFFEIIAAGIAACF